MGDPQEHSKVRVHELQKTIQVRDLLRVYVPLLQEVRFRNKLLQATTSQGDQCLHQSSQAALQNHLHVAVSEQARQIVLGKRQKFVGWLKDRETVCKESATWLFRSGIQVA